MEKIECAVYVASLDAYSDLWQPFFELFWKNWPDCPYPVYLGGNTKRFEHQRVNMLYAGPHSNWTDRAREHLMAIDATYVLMMLDDWFLTKAVDTPKLAELIGLLRKFDGTMLRLVADPKPDFALAGHPAIGLLKVGKLNRTNTHATIWKKDDLLSLMRDGESLWQFEVNGSIRSNVQPGGMFAVWRTALIYMGAVDAGKWTRRAARTLDAMGVERDQSARGVKTVRETLKHSLSKALAFVFRSVTSLRFRQSVKQLVGGAAAYREKR